MSEEEIKDVFETVIRANRFSGIYSSIDIIIEAMKGLLDLYKQEKEKNKEKKIIADSFHEKMAEKFDEDFIKKSKIKEKMKKYEWALEDYDSDTADYKQSQDIGSWIALQQLLEGE